MTPNQDLKALGSELAAIGGPDDGVMPAAEDGGYEVRHAAEGETLATQDLTQEVEAIVLPGARYAAPDRVYTAGERLAVPLGEVVLHPAALQTLPEWQVAQARAQRLAPKLEEGQRKREGLQAMYRDQFEAGLPQDRQEALRKLREDHAGRVVAQEARLGQEEARLKLREAEERLAERAGHWSRVLEGMSAEEAQALRTVWEKEKAGLDAAVASARAEIEKRRPAAPATKPAAPPVAPAAAVAVPGSHAAAVRSVRERLAELQLLMQDGLITPEICEARQREIVRDL